MRIAFFILGVATAAAAQSLTIAPAGGSPGSEVSLKMSLDSPPGKAPAALQMEVVFAGQLLDLEASHPQTAQASGKSVTCAQHKPYSYTCIVFGGQQPIANGAIAALHFKIHPDARLGATTVRIQNVQAVDADLKKVPLKDAEGIITIR